MAREFNYEALAHTGYDTDMLRLVIIWENDISKWALDIQMDINTILIKKLRWNWSL